jgi:hypothetical protein
MSTNPRPAPRRIGPTGTPLRNGDRRWSMPNAQLLERVVTRS